MKKVNEMKMPFIQQKRKLVICTKKKTINYKLLYISEASYMYIIYIMLLN